MGTFDAACSQCGSIEHTISTCPHALYSTACAKCGSKEHSIADCPHALYSTECSTCGSKEHNISDCPHGLYSTECSRCGSKEHNTSDCPHGMYSTECSRCGSKNHATTNCPHGMYASRVTRPTSDAEGARISGSGHSSDADSSTGTELVGKILGVLVVIAAILWFVFSVAIPLLLINMALLALIAAHVKRNLRQWLLPLSAFGAALVVADYNAGWSTRTLVTNVSFFASAIPVLVYLNLLAGLAALYLIVRDYLNRIKPLDPSEGEFSRRNLAIMGCLLVVGGVTAGVQEHVRSVASSGVPPSQAASVHLGPPSKASHQSVATPATPASAPANASVGTHSQAAGADLTGKWEGHYWSFGQDGKPFLDTKGGGCKIAIVREGANYRVTVFGGGYDWNAETYDEILASMQDGKLVGTNHRFHDSTGFEPPNSDWYKGGVPTFEVLPDGTLKATDIDAGSLATLKRLH